MVSLFRSFYSMMLQRRFSPLCFGDLFAIVNCHFCVSLNFLGFGHIQVFGGAAAPKDASGSNGWTVQICIQCNNSVHWKSETHLAF